MPRSIAKLQRWWKGNARHAALFRDLLESPVARRSNQFVTKFLQDLLYFSNLIMRDIAIYLAASHHKARRNQRTMKRIVTALVLPLLLFFAPTETRSSPNKTAATKGQSGTLQKMIVDSGT